MPRPRAWTHQLLPLLRMALLELAGPEGEDRPPDELLGRLADRFPVVGRGLVELMARDPSARVSEQAALLLFYTARYAPQRLKMRVVGTSADDLLEAMKDPLVADERKYTMGPLLATLGREIPDAEYQSCFHDFDGTVERMSRDGITSLLDSPEQLEALLAFHGLIGPEAEDLSEPRLIEALERGIETLLHNAQVGAALVVVTAGICREKGVATEPALAALDLVARSKTSRGEWYLRELASLPGGTPAWGSSASGSGPPAPSEIRERARALLEGLGPGKPQPVGPFSHGLVSALDGEGSRDVVLFYRTAEGTFDGVAILLNESQGLLDIFASFGDGADLERQARERFTSWAPCDLAYARELVADALALHDRTGRAVPGRYLLSRPYLGEEPIIPGVRRAELGVYALETIVPDPQIVTGSEALAEHEVFGDLGTTSDAAYAFARARGKRRTLERFLSEVVVAEKGVFLARLATALEVEARAGRARLPINRLAARVYLAIESELLPFEQVPYVRAIARKALAAIERNVKKGYRSQAEASVDAEARARSS